MLDNKKAIIITSTLKNFLSLFNGNSVLENLELGDTWHPSSGFVDQDILKGKRKVHEIIEFEYNFEGLVCFEAEIENMKLRLLTGSNYLPEKLKFQVIGSVKNIQSLRVSVIEKKACSPDSYQINLISNYD